MKKRAASDMHNWETVGKKVKPKKDAKKEISRLIDKMGPVQTLGAIITLAREYNKRASGDNSFKGAAHMLTSLGLAGIWAEDDYLRTKFDGDEVAVKVEFMDPDEAREEVCESCGCYDDLSDIDEPLHKAIEGLSDLAEAYAGDGFSDDDLFLIAATLVHDFILEAAVDVINDDPGAFRG